MVDIVGKSVRSRMMASIGGKNTKPELKVRSYLHNRGFRYRIHVRSLPGCPDLVLPKYRLVIFVHGCFWHRHAGCRYVTSPDQNAEKWRYKFEQNVLRDHRNVNQLLDNGWRVFIIWECGLRKATHAEDLHWLSQIVADDKVRFFEWPQLLGGEAIETA
jgi:DNA mismatch endonuclease (patch repair protein)